MRLVGILLDLLWLDRFLVPDRVVVLLFKRGRCSALTMVVIVEYGRLASHISLGGLSQHQGVRKHEAV